MPTVLATLKVAIDLIDVVPDFNVRKSFDKEELKQMAQTITDTRIVQPVKVKQKEDGRFDLVWIAVHRRRVHETHYQPTGTSDG